MRFAAALKSTVCTSALLAALATTATKPVSAQSWRCTNTYYGQNCRDASGTGALKIEQQNVSGPIVETNGTAITLGPGSSWAGITADTFGGIAVNITNTGSISSNADYYPAIMLSSMGGDISLTNTGRITTAGAYSSGIDTLVMPGQHGTTHITNSGDITLTGAGGRGIAADSSLDGITIVNSGDIDTALGTRNGILARSGRAYTEMSGSTVISYLIDPGGDVSISNSGNVTMRDGAPAIMAHSVGARADIVNSGRVVSKGPAIVAGSGIIRFDSQTGALTHHVAGAGASVVNSGIVVSTSAVAPAISAQSGGDVSITNTATGIVASSGWAAVFAQSHQGDATVDNQGVVRANGTNVGTVAINAFSGGDMGGIVMPGRSVAVRNSGTATAAADYGAAIRAASQGNSDAAAGSVVVDNQATGFLRYSGVRGAGIHATADHGTVTVSNAGTVAASGDDSGAIEARAGWSQYDQYGNIVSMTPGGDVSVHNTGLLTAGGFGGFGIRAASTQGDVAVVNDVTPPPAGAAAGVAPVPGVIVVKGDGSDGIWATSATGRVDVTNRGRIVTVGADSAGITFDLGGVGAGVVNEGAIVGMGVGSAGIRGESSGSAESGSPLMAVANAGVIKQFGAYSVGIGTHIGTGVNRVDNTGTIVVGAIPGATAISSGAAALPTEPAGGSVGIFATANGGGDILISSTGRIRANGSDSYGIFAAGLGGGAIGIDIGAGGLVQGGSGAKTFGLATGANDVILTGSAGIAVAGGDHAAITNAGTVTGLNGMAITVGEGTWRLTRQEPVYDSNGNIVIDPESGLPRMRNVVESITLLGGRTDISNTGRIIGDIRLGSGSDVIFNEAGGTISGSVDMGAGISQFLNAGTFDMGARVDLGAGYRLLNDGTISPGGKGTIARTLVVGDLTQRAAGTYLVDIDPTRTSGPRSDFIGVTGTTFLGGTVAPNFLDVSAGLGRQYLIGRSLVDASGTAKVLTVKDTVGYDLAIDYLATNYGIGSIDPGANAKDIFLTVTKSGSLKSVAAKAASSVNLSQTSAGNIGSLALALDNAETAGALTGLTSQLRLAADGRSALDQMQRLLPLDQAAQISRTTAASLGFGAAMRNCATDVADAKTGESRSAQAGCTWGRYSFGAAPVAGDVPFALAVRDDGYESGNAGRRNMRDTANLAFGSQTAIGNGWSLGVASAYETLGFGTSDNATAGAGASQGERAIAGISLNHAAGSLETSLNLIGTYGWYDNDRATGTGMAHSDQQVASTLAGLRLAYRVDSGPLYVRPMVDVSANFLRLGGYTETGAAASSLALAGADKWQLAVVPGVEIGAAYSGFGWTLKPYARAGVSFASGDDMAMSARFAAAPAIDAFMVSSRMDHVMAEIEAGVNLLSTGGISAKLSYQGHVGTVTEDHTGGLKVQMPF